MCSGPWFGVRATTQAAGQCGNTDRPCTGGTSSGAPGTLPVQGVAFLAIAGPSR